MIRVCGVGSRCERHDVRLHGYPCHACGQEWARRFPRVRALITRQASGQGAVVTPAQVTAARKADARAFHGDVVGAVVRRSGGSSSGPVSRLWNAVCSTGCGWSYYWAKSRDAASVHARAHMDEHDPRPARNRHRYVWTPCTVCGAAEDTDCTALRGPRAGQPLAAGTHAGRRSRKVPA